MGSNIMNVFSWASNPSGADRHAETFSRMRTVKCSNSLVFKVWARAPWGTAWMQSESRKLDRKMTENAQEISCLIIK